MKAYSKDLRERVVAAIDKGDQTKGEVAEEYEVSYSFIKKILKQRRELGHIEPLGHGGGQQAKLKKQQIEFVERQVEKHPDWSLAEYCAKVEKRYSIVVSSPTMCRILQKLELTRKKKSYCKRAKQQTA